MNVWEVILICRRYHIKYVGPWHNQNIAWRMVSPEWVVGMGLAGGQQDQYSPVCSLLLFILVFMIEGQNKWKLNLMRNKENSKYAFKVKASWHIFFFLLTPRVQYLVFWDKVRLWRMFLFKVKNPEKNVLVWSRPSFNLRLSQFQDQAWANLFIH